MSSELIENELPLLFCSLPTKIFYYRNFFLLQLKKWGQEVTLAWLVLVIPSSWSFSEVYSLQSLLLIKIYVYWNKYSFVVWPSLCRNANTLLLQYYCIWKLKKGALEIPSSKTTFQVKPLVLVSFAQKNLMTKIRNIEYCKDDKSLTQKTFWLWTELDVSTAKQ